jgi:hypothetical protein
MEDNKVMDLMEAAERLETVAAMLEQVAAQMDERQKQMDERESVERIVATVDDSVPTVREQELERRLAEAEAQIAQLTAHAPKEAVAVHGTRKTVAAGTAALLAKQGLAVDASGAGVDAAALDGALASLSMEQRFAVKAELLRAGLLG